MTQAAFVRFAGQVASHCLIDVLEEPDDCKVVEVQVGIDMSGSPSLQSTMSALLYFDADTPLPLASPSQCQDTSTPVVAAC